MKIDPLYLTEAQIAERVGLSLRDWQAAAIVLETQGLPTADPVFGDMRYWPAVRAFLDRRYQLDAQFGEGNYALDGEERWITERKTLASRQG